MKTNAKNLSNCVSLKESLLAATLLSNWNTRVWTLLESMEGREAIHTRCKIGFRSIPADWRIRDSIHRMRGGKFPDEATCQSYCVRCDLDCENYLVDTERYYREQAFESFVPVITVMPASDEQSLHHCPVIMIMNQCTWDKLIVLLNNAT